jgi:RimJ/RimL family protein N-acetyltransferase
LTQTDLTQDAMPWRRMLDTTPVIETPRLLLRAPIAEDFPAWRDNMADVETMRFLGGAVSPLMAWRNMMTVVGAWPIVGFSMFSVIEKSTGQWVGRLGPWRPEGWPGNEIGWALARSAEGKGYATEGAQAAMDFAFERLGWDQCIHSIDADNTASIAVAMRLGSWHMGKAELPPPLDKAIEMYGQTRADWLARRSAAG